MRLKSKKQREMFTNLFFTDLSGNSFVASVFTAVLIGVLARLQVARAKRPEHKPRAHEVLDDDGAIANVDLIVL